MSAFYRIVYSDYLQRTRSYAFLITLAIALYAAYAFMPAPNADYTTVRVGHYVGVQNSAWTGYVTAMMSCTFICWIGFYLVNSGIQKDIQTGVGMIIATTGISNFRYLMAKALSNFLVLTSILGCTFLMSIALFSIRDTGYAFEPLQFIIPYLVIAVPSIFFFSALAVTAEVFLYRFSVLQNIGAFFFFCFIITLQLKVAPIFDILGVKPVTTAMEQTVLHQYKDTVAVSSIGFNFSKKSSISHFVFTGVNWPISIILSRIAVICAGLIFVFLSSLFFHRFDIRERIKIKKKIKIIENPHPLKQLKDIRLSELPPVVTSYKIMPFIKTELLMLFRKGPKWLWFINLGGMIALLFAPLEIAHQIILPVIWFLQVGRWADLSSKEKTNRIHYFTFASYKPLTRLLPAQIAAGIISALALALPLLLRYVVLMQFSAILSIVSGSVFVILLAVALGILSGGKKLFEIIFFLLTYFNVNKVPFTDYFGGMHQNASYLISIGGLIALLIFISFTLRKMEIRRL